MTIRAEVVYNKETMSFNPLKWFKGRVDRKSFFLGLIVNSLVTTIILVVAFKVSNLLYQPESPLILKFVDVIAIFLIYLEFLIFSLSLYARRLHDFGKSGWWTLLLLVPIINIIFFVYLVVKRGDEDSNKYGEKHSFMDRRLFKGFVVILLTIFLFGLVGFVAYYQKQRADVLVKEGDEALLTYNPHTAFRKYEQAQATWPFLNSDEHIKQQKKMATDMFQNPGVIIFLKDGASTQDIQSLMEEIKALKSVERIQFTSKEKALEIYKNATKPDDMLTKLLRTDIFPASLDVYLTDDSVKDKIVQIAESKAFVESASKYVLK